MKLTKTSGEVKEYTLNLNHFAWVDGFKTKWEWVIERIADTKPEPDGIISYGHEGYPRYHYSFLKFYSRKTITLKQIEDTLATEWKIHDFEQRISKLEERTHSHEGGCLYEWPVGTKHWWRK